MRGHALLPMVALALAPLALAGCGGSDSSSASQQAHLYQASPGEAPSIRMGWEGSSIVAPSDVVAWLIYRAGYAYFNAEASTLVEARGDQSITEYEDGPDASPSVTFSRDFTYLNYGSQEAGSVTATYTHPALVEGQAYYYRARRVFRPNRSAVPISSAAATALSVDPSSALSEASSPQGPVHYFDAPAQTGPPVGAGSVDPTNVTFRWTNPDGADQFQVSVYRNSSLTGLPVLQAGNLTFPGTSGQYTYNTGARSSALAGSTTYYWVVGARHSTEAYPYCGTVSGWLLSDVRQFTTAPTPPSGP
jgi:hypothetical protein